MVRYINEENILNAVKDKELLDELQITNLKLIQAKTKENFIKIIIQQEVIDNELMIDILQENLSFRGPATKFSLFSNTFLDTVVKPGGDISNSLLIRNINGKIYDYSRFKEYIIKGYFVYEGQQNNKIIAINDLRNLFLLASTKNSIRLIKKLDFYKILEKNFAHLNIIKSKYFLEFTSDTIIAKNINYSHKIIFFLTVFFIILIYFPLLFHITNNAGYFLQNFLKILLFSRAVFSYNTRSEERSLYIIGESMSKKFPIYTILIPLYKETGKLKSILKNVALLNYPKNKLDVKLIIEADDYLMIREIGVYNLPSYIHILQVPISLPKTKPKALNYALQYSRGKYLVVYDAEDMPDPNQLIAALKAFEILPPEYACLQAKLNFYNKDENLLTKMFSIEYSLWFEYILKGLSLLDLPVTLGGTSNHFKTDILYDIGGWDAYNVTEDAELGIRLYSRGYKVYMIDSYTLEESPIGIGNWLNQRSRWIKGFLQTFFIFKAQRDKYKKFNLKQIFTIYIFIGLSSYSFWCLPFIIFTIIINENPIINYLWLINGFFAFSYLYISACYIIMTYRKRAKLRFLDIIALILWPSYFILHTIASYKAFWEIIFQPFKWNKTKHGVSMQNFD
ncbi:glycosyltransferase family 2 protein [Rickettsia endosymbiont of Halotydeus destructor]|uniref:glycosyltransferase family 2 protein n=1 Tax=Rickettsia endosymbiont of Halotydeus destructor TaxID=2996754 RepID=UPI003BAF85E7